MFFENATSFGATEACRSWGEEWKSHEGDLMQNIDEELQGCLKSMIESAKNDYFKDNSGGFFLGGSQGEDSPGWYWHNGDQIEVRLRYLSLSIML